MTLTATGEREDSEEARSLPRGERPCQSGPFSAPSSRATTGARLCLRKVEPGLNTDHRLPSYRRYPSLSSLPCLRFLSRAWLIKIQGIVTYYLLFSAFETLNLGEIASTKGNCHCRKARSSNGMSEELEVQVNVRGRSTYINFPALADPLPYPARTNSI